MMPNPFLYLRPMWLSIIFFHPIHQRRLPRSNCGSNIELGKNLPEGDPL
jgi:hypothetical protein